VSSTSCVTCAARARPLQLLNDEVTEAATAPAGGDGHRAQQCDRLKTLQAAGAYELAIHMSDDELGFEEVSRSVGRPARSKAGCGCFPRPLRGSLQRGTAISFRLPRRRSNSRRSTAALQLDRIGPHGIMTVHRALAGREEGFPLHTLGSAIQLSVGCERSSRSWRLPRGPAARHAAKRA